MRDELRDVVGIGNAIVDVLSPAAPALLEKHALTPGTMTLVDEERARRVYDEMENRVECSGGSAANTMAGIASLGGRAAYIGKVRDDSLGLLFRDDIRRAGVEFRTAPATEGPATGRCMVLVTPDAQRTMLTFLGASATLAVADLDPELIRRARITYLEGYLWDPAPAKEAFLEAARTAHAAGRKVALSLSDSFCVDRHRSEFRDLLAHQVDILLCNEAEIASLYETRTTDEAVRILRERCAVAAVTRGAEGAVVVASEQTLEVPAEPVDRVVDTTGAGDLFASGFLFGLARGRAPAVSARLGGIAAAEVISHFGARPRASLRMAVRSARLDSTTREGEVET